MKNFITSIASLFSLFLFSGCGTTFAGSLLVLSFRDIILYVFLAFIIALIISLKSGTKRKRAFWIGFILSLLLTPIAGFIYLLILFSIKSKE